MRLIAWINDFVFHIGLIWERIHSLVRGISPISNRQIWLNMINHQRQHSDQFRCAANINLIRSDPIWMDIADAINTENSSVRTNRTGFFGVFVCPHSWEHLWPSCSNFCFVLILVVSCAYWRPIPLIVINLTQMGRMWYIIWLLRFVVFVACFRLFVSIYLCVRK